LVEHLETDRLSEDSGQTPARDTWTAGIGRSRPFPLAVASAVCGNSFGRESPINQGRCFESLPESKAPKNPADRKQAGDFPHTVGVGVRRRRT